MRPALKILLTTDAVGGVWTYTINLAQALRGKSVNVVIAALGPPPSQAQMEEAASAGANLRILDAPLDWLSEDEAGVAQASRDIAALARRMRVDILQVHSPALLAHAIMPAPSVSVIHSCAATWWEAVRGDALPADLRWRVGLAAMGLARASVNIAPSRSFATSVARLYGVEPPTVVYNGRSSTRAAQGEPARFILSAGRFWDDGKNLATLDDAAALCETPVMAAGALIAPDGARQQTAHVEALGALDSAALQKLLYRRPLFCSTALYEPFGLSVLEAAQAGCALVLSAIPTFQELWTDAALFAPPRDAKAFAAALNALAKDRDWRSALGEAAKSRAAQFSPERQAQEMRGIYDNILQRARSEAAA